MKIEITIPDWPDDEHKDFFLLAGSEQRAFYRHYEKKWHVKTVPCNQCGLCCMNLVDDGQYQLDEQGDCIHLDKSNDKVRPCKLGVMRPWPCVEGDLTANKENKKLGNICCIRYDGEK